MDNRKKTAKRILTILVLTAVCSVVMPETQTVQAATNKYDKVLKLYKKKKYKKAQTAAKKLPKKANEKCVKRMSKKMKKAYREIVKSYENYSPNSGKKFDGYLTEREEVGFSGYYLTDLDNDKKPELIVKYGPGETGKRITVYRYKKGKAVKIVDAFPSAHCWFYAYPNGKGLVMVWGHMGSETVGRYVLKNGTLHRIDYGGRQVTEAKDTIAFPYELDSHWRQTKSGKSYFSYADLQ